MEYPQAFDVSFDKETTTTTSQYHILNHHHLFVFLIGNSIVAMLFALFRHHNHHDDHEPPPCEIKYDEEEKKIVVVHEAEEEENHVVVMSPQCDDVAAAIEEATRQIRRFERTQSERLRREIGAKPKGELRRSASSGEKEEDMERLSSDEFRQTVDDFISKHWTNKTRATWI